MFRKEKTFYFARNKLVYFARNKLVYFARNKLVYFARNKLVYLKTFGCRLNQAESQMMREKLIGEGWREERLEKADLVIINSCVVTKKAQKEVVQFVRRVKRENPFCQLWLVGCLADFGKIDKKIFSLPVDRWLTNKEKKEWLGQKVTGIIPVKLQPRRLVKIQEGCNHFCRYCLVPFVRGKSVSVPADFIIDRIKKLVGGGTDWVVLTGVEIIDYQDKNLDFLDLVEKALQETEVKLLSFGSISPLIGKEGGERLIKIYQKFPQRIARHLHLSLQSGSDRILKLMGRGYSSLEYRELAERLKTAIPQLNLTTDIIVGFPGETEKDWRQTLNFVRKIEFGKIHIFRFSSRPGTLVAKKGRKWGIVSQEVKKQRAKQLALVEKKLRLNFWRSLLGTEAWAMFFETEKSLAGIARGQSDNFVPVVSGSITETDLGQLVKVRFEKIDENDQVWVEKID